MSTIQFPVSSAQPPVSSVQFSEFRSTFRFINDSTAVPFTQDFSIPRGIRLLDGYGFQCLHGATLKKFILNIWWLLLYNQKDVIKVLFSFLPWVVFEKRRVKRKREKAAWSVYLFGSGLVWCEGWCVKKVEDEDKEFTIPVVFLLNQMYLLSISAPNSLLRKNLRTNDTTSNFSPFGPISLLARN
ncbi:hypothetical protein K501DRAFT_266564 [Backusella circina FSU 941]|nr:hypothetical protein K501DRAFT_266564 [Backusella circina FSU 941]